MPPQRFSFGLRTFLILPAVAVVFAVLNLRPAYPNWLRDDVSFRQMAMRQYGWPLTFVDQYFEIDWSQTPARVQTHPSQSVLEIKDAVYVHRLGKIRWLPLLGNIALAVVTCYLCIVTCNWLFRSESKLRCFR